MGFFSKLFGKKQKPAPAPVTPVEPVVSPAPQPEIVAKPEPQVVIEPAIKAEVKEVVPPTPEVAPIPVEEPPVFAPAPEEVTLPVTEIQPAPLVVEEQPSPVVETKPEPPVAPALPAEPAKPRYAGKYEVFPEAGLFKYRLKASNGEILIVSNGYTTRNGAATGIETLKKNLETGKFELITDKNNFSQFRLYTQNGSRQIAAGEFYETMKRAESAMESVKKFAGTDKIIDMEELPVAEIREEVITLKPIDKNPNGKYEIGNYEGQWIAMLKASNGEVLFVTAGYASKSGLLNGLESIKKAVAAENFRVSKDKQGRFQFKLYSPINQLILVGETYGSKEACFSSVDSVRRFAQDAKLVE
jgi:uncharacterized protein